MDGHGGRRKGTERYNKGRGEGRGVFGIALRSGGGGEFRAKVFVDASRGAGERQVKEEKKPVVAKARRRCWRCGGGGGMPAGVEERGAGGGGGGGAVVGGAGASETEIAIKYITGEK